MNNTPLDPIANLSVRIATGKKVLGSGFIVYPEHGDTLYIVTARHCILNVAADEPILVEFYNYDQKQFLSHTAHPDSIYFGAEIDYDIAILFLPKDSISLLLISSRLVSSIPDSQKYFFRGFPNGHQGNKPVKIKVTHSLTSGLSTILDNELDRPEEHYTDADVNVAGFSGSGLVYEFGNQVFLAGVITHYDSKFNQFTAYNISQINELLIQNGYIPLLIENVKTNNNEEITESAFIIQNREALQQAEQLCKHFKTQQANILVESVYQSVEDSNLKGDIRNTLLAKTHYLKALIESDLEAGVDTNALLIQAYRLHQEKKEYRERAASAYYLKKDEPNAYKISANIIKEDPENVRAWVIMARLKPNLQVPDSVKASPIFKIGQVAHLANTGKRVSIERMMPLFSDELNNQPMPIMIDRSNIYYWNYVAQTAMHHCFQKEGRFIHLEKPDQFKNDELLKYACNLFDRICASVFGTDFQENEMFRVARFDYCICQYYLSVEPNEERQIAEEIFRLFVGDQTLTNAPFMRLRTPISELIPDRLCEVLIICLQQQKPQLVIQAIAKISDSDRPEIQMLLGKAYALNNQPDKTVDAYRRYLNLVDETIDQLTAATFLEVIKSLIIAGQPSDVILSWVIGEKTFTHSYVKYLLIAFCQSNDSSKQDVVKQAADKAKPYWDELIPMLKKALAVIYSDIKEWGTTKVLWKELVGNGTEESDILLVYLLTLYEEHIEFTELATWLAYWREHFSPNVGLTSREATIYRKLNNYSKLDEVANYGMNHFPDNSMFWLDRVRALHRLGDTDNLLPLLDQRLLTFKIPPEIRMSLAHVYIIHGKTEMGQEACYQVLKENWSNPKIKMAYFTLSAQYKVFANRPLPEIIQEGMVVLLAVEGKRQILELTFETLLYNPIAQKLIGLHINESIQYEEPFSDHPITYTIIQIFDKYQGQCAIITEEIQQKPHGMPIKSLALPKSEDPEELLSLMSATLGLRETERYFFNSEAKRDFADSKIGFIELAHRVFSGNPLATWEYVTSNYVDGFPIIPLVNVNKQQALPEINQETEFVLDFSSLLTIYHLVEKGRLCSFNKPFIVSQYVIDYIGFELEQAMHNQASGISLNFQGGRYIPYFHPEDLQERQIKFWSSLRDWVGDNCKPDYAWERLGWKWKDGKGDPDLLFSDQKMYISGFWDSLLLANRHNRLLITDDLFVFNKLPNHFVIPITTEWYLRDYHTLEYDFLWVELVRLNMRGLTVDGRQLFQTFYENRLSTLVTNDYLKARQNLALQYNPTILSPLEAIRFLKSVFVENLPIDYKRQQVRELFQVIFANTAPLTEKVLSLLLECINYQFHLLGNYGDLVKEEFYCCLNGSLSREGGLTG
ncbi:S1 family peptidase [Runella slithyformis]|uniref:PIN domain-containing protein n=1 Tax=Runella slithyformis (strain ATCC 29530 / DSM 19594 / LMG 11500 / NCIMB 11436 / LSU 4) TaxID=761193 RepID=A0A7U3ZRQ9_RUNSL|nr:serine protease [Runella slithyformis]AEI52161.1 hypothetical protein Runsl_5865 [Runella slithyformis DSM 19594]